MNQSKRLCKAVVTSLLLCCAMSTSSHANILRRGAIGVIKASKTKPGSIEKLMLCNKILAAAKGLDCLGEAARIATMQSTKKEVIQAAALANAVTNAFVVATTLFTAYKNRWMHDAKPISYFYPVANISVNLFDLVKSLMIAINAEEIALTNEENLENGKINSNAIYVLLGLLAAEASCSVYAQKAIINQKDMMLNLQKEADEIIEEKVQPGGFVASLAAKTCALAFWIARHIYEFKYCNPSQPGTNPDVALEDDSEKVL